MAVMTLPAGGALSAPTGRYDFLVPHLIVLRRYRRAIAWVTFAAMLVTALIAKLAMDQMYRAQALLRPVTEGWTANGVISMLGGVGLALQSRSQGLLGGPGENEADEYIAIMQSYAFTSLLIDRFKLAPELIAHFDGWHTPTRRDLCDELMDGFDATYDMRTGNITLSYEYRDPRAAEKILDHYITVLRDQLRGREIDASKAAVASLEQAAGKTPDALLRANLYELMAKQIEREKVAEMEADFAFRVIDPPGAPDRKVSPKTTLACLVVGILACLLSTAVIFGLHYTRGIKAEMRWRLEKLNDRSEASEPAGIE